MKRIIQLILSLFLILAAVLFYNIYFTSDKKVGLPSIAVKDQLSIEKKNNLIKNLKYDVNLDKNKKYNITADLSELIYIDNVEIISMQKVIAIFSDEDGIPITIKSNAATYNNSTFETNFNKNVRIEYLDNLIVSDKVDINFNENIISIYDNVEYEGSRGMIKSDNLIINLITNDIEIYMNDKKKKVKLKTK